MALIGSLDFDDFDNVTIAYDGNDPTTVILTKAGKAVKTVNLTYANGNVSSIEIIKKNKTENLTLSYTESNITQISKEVS